MECRLRVVFLIIASLLATVGADVSDLRLCADPNCQEPVSQGFMVINYNSNDEKILSFANGAQVTIYSKEAGRRKGLWGVEIKGKRGYVPKQYVRESKLFIKDLKYEVPTEDFINKENTWDNHDKYNIDNEDSDNNQELIKNSVNEDKLSGLEEIAISAEDVEYNRIKVETEEQQHHHGEREGLTREVEESEDEIQEQPRHSDGVETVSVDIDEHESEEKGVDDAEKKGTEEDLGDLVSESDKESNGSNREEEEEEDQEQQEQNVEQFDIAGENFVPKMLKKNGSLSDLVTADATTELNESTKNSFDTDHYNAKSKDSFESSSVNYEVIDGTTVYLDDVVTVTVSTPVDESSTLLEASSGMNEKLVSEHPHPSLSRASLDTSQSRIVNTQPTVAASLEDIGSVVPDTVSSTYIDKSDQTTPSLPIEKEPIVQEKKPNPDINPSSSWLFNVATTVSSWVNGEEEIAIEESKEEVSDGMKHANKDSEGKRGKSNYSQENLESINEGSNDVSPTINTISDEGSTPASPTINTISDEGNTPVSLTINTISDEGNTPVSPTINTISDEGNTPVSPTINTISDEGNTPVSPTINTISDEGNTPVSPTINTISDEGSTPGSPTINTISDDSIGATDNTPNAEEFGGPKPWSVVETSDIQAEKVAESGGFFSSLFGSSENTDSLEVEESPNVIDSSESPSVLKESEEGDVNNSSDDGRADRSEADPTDSSNIAATDIVNVSVDDPEIPENVVQAPYPTDVDYNAFTTQQHAPSLVGDDPPPSVSSTPKQYPEISFETDDQPPMGVLGNVVNDISDKEISEEDTHINDTDIVEREEPSIATISEVEDPTHPSPSSEDEEDPGPSTARPMYAEPQPTSQDYPSDSHVDSNNIVHLTAGDKVGTMDDSEGVDVVPDEGSLTEEFLRASHSLLPEGLAFGVEAEVADPHMSAGAIVFLLIVVFTIITIYFVHLIMLKSSREAPMLRALNHVEHENRLMAEENTSLHEQLCKARAELEAVSSCVMAPIDDDTESDSRLEKIKSEYDKEKAQLEERIVQLEHELEEATSNGLEMHKMLSEMLTAQKDTSAFQASVDHLQAMLDGQREKVETLTSDLALKTRLNEELQNELSVSLERTNKLDYQVQQLTQSLQELTATKEEINNRLERETILVKELKEANYSLSQETCKYDMKISSLSSELEELKDTICQLRESVETKESELQVAKECLKQLRLTSDDDLTAPDEEKLLALFDVIRVKAELHRVNRERNDLSEQLQDAEMAQQNLEEAMLSIRSEVAELRAHHDFAIQEKQEALSKLSVLSQYFGEKEAHLTKELESQEGLRLNAEGSAAAISKKIQNYELELASYKGQVESLRKELEDQENSYKVQIASHEQKAHENWLQARAAERKHDEQRRENSQLRNRLTLLQKEKEETQQLQINIIKPTPKRVDANGSMSSPGPILDGVVDGNHSGVSSMHRDVDSPPVPPHPMHGPPPILSMMFPPGGPLPPGVPPPHGLPPGIPPPPGLPHGVPPPHGLPPPPFLSGEPPFIGPLHPLPGDRRLPPAGGMSSPPFRRSGSPSYDHRNDRYSPGSDRSHFSDRRYSPPPLRNRPPSPELHRNRSPDRRSDRTRSPDRRSDRMRSPDHRSNRHTPERRLDRRSPDRHFSTRSPDGYTRHRSSPHYFHQSDYSNDDPRLRSAHIKGKKPTALGSSDR